MNKPTNKRILLLSIALIFTMACSCGLIQQITESFQQAVEEVVPSVEMGEEYRSEEGGYAFSTIPDATVEDLWGLVSMSVADADTEYGPAIFLIGEAIEEETTLDEQFDYEVNEFDTEDLDISEPKDLNVAGKPAREVEFTGEHEDGTPLQGRLVVVLVEPTQTFTLFAYAPVDRWDEFAPYIDGVVASLTFFTPTEPGLDLDSDWEEVDEGDEIEEEVDEGDQPIQDVGEGEGLFLTGTQGVITNEYSTYGAFLVSNPQANCKYDSAQFDYIAYDANGNELIRESGYYLDTVLPNGQALEIIYFPEEAKAATRFEVTLNPGSCEASDVTADSLYITNPLFIDDEFFPQASAQVHNNLDVYQTSLNVGALGFNAAGDLVAAGSAYLNQVFPSDFTGAMVYLNVSDNETIDRIEFYPTHSFSTTFEVDNSYFETAFVDSYMPAIVANDKYEVVFFVHNSDTTQAATDIQYQLTVMAENGDVVAVQTGWINHILPDDTAVIYSSISTPEGMEGVRHFVELLPGEFDTPQFASNPFTTDNYNLDDEDFWPTVTFDLTNGSDKSVTDLRMVVVIYDADENFIGGGYGSSETIAAGATLNQSVTVNFDGEASFVEVYLVIDYWTTIE
jgi:hypothetical protein